MTEAERIQLVEMSAKSSQLYREIVFTEQKRIDTYHELVALDIEAEKMGKRKLGILSILSFISLIGGVAAVILWRQDRMIYGFGIGGIVLGVLGLWSFFYDYFAYFGRTSDNVIPARMARHLLHRNYHYASEDIMLKLAEMEKEIKAMKAEKEKLDMQIDYLKNEDSKG